jgi:hypothetical protein
VCVFSSQLAQDKPRKKRKASKNKSGAVMTSELYIRGEEDDRAAEVQADISKENARLGRLRAELMRVVQKCEKELHKAGLSLKLLEKHTLLLEDATSTLMRGENHLTLAKIQTLIVSRQGKTCHGTKVQLVRGKQPTCLSIYLDSHSLQGKHKHICIVVTKCYPRWYTSRVVSGKYVCCCTPSVETRYH